MFDDVRTLDKDRRSGGCGEEAGKVIPPYPTLHGPQNTHIRRCQIIKCFLVQQKDKKYTLCTYVHTYVRMYICTYVCTYVHTYVCIHNDYTYAFIYINTYVYV